MLYSIEQQMAEQDGKCNWYAGSDSNNINLYSCDIGLLDINDIGKYKNEQELNRSNPEEPKINKRLK